MGGVFAPGTYSFVGDEMISVAGGDFRWMGVVALISHSLEVSVNFKAKMNFKHFNRFSWGFRGHTKDDFSSYK